LFLCTFSGGIDRKALELVLRIELEKPIY